MRRSTSEPAVLTRTLATGSTAGLDVVTVSRRLGHAGPARTLAIYSHLFTIKDAEAAAALVAVLG